jgi:hypothetical protein
MSQKNQKNFQENEETTGQFPDILRRVCAGLIYISETDAPVVPFLGGKAARVSNDAILQYADPKPRGEMSEVAFGPFFERLTTVREWYGTAEITMTQRFLELQRLLEENLTDLKVFMIGTIQLDIFAVGLDREGRLVGVRTKAVET